MFILNSNIGNMIILAAVDMNHYNGIKKKNLQIPSRTIS